MKNILIVLFLLIINVSVSSQEESKSASLNIEGQIAITTNGKAAFVNFGGPALKFNFNRIAFALNFMPSLKVEEQNSTITLAPILGTGVQFYFLKNKRFILSFPMYYYANKNSWIATAGVGYVISKPKK